MTGSVPMTLSAKQARFACLLAQLVVWIFEQGWAVTLGEGGVSGIRKVLLPDGLTVAKVVDREHMKGSLHYVRLAQDLNLFVDGKYITDGDHPAYASIGKRWESMDPLCRWGGRFNDANHFSLAHEGRA